MSLAHDEWCPVTNPTCLIVNATVNVMELGYSTRWSLNADVVYVNLKPSWWYHRKLVKFGNGRQFRNRLKLHDRDLFHYVNVLNVLKKLSDE